MATTDIKVRIHNIVDNIHDESQKDLLVVLEDIKHNAIDEKQVEMAKRIIADNKILLQKLAQE